MSGSFCQIVGRLLARIGAAVGVRRDAGPAGGGRPWRNWSTIARLITGSKTWVRPQTRSEPSTNWLHSANRPYDACSMSSTTKCPCRAAAPIDTHRSAETNALVRLAKRHPDAVLKYFQTHNYLNPSLNSVLSMSGDERLKALAAQAAKQDGWVKLPEFERTNPQARRTEPHVAVDRAEIDGLIQHMGLGSEGAIHTIEKIVALGEPALRRLIEVYYGDTRIPMEGDPRDDPFSSTLGRMAKRYPDLTLELVRGRRTVPWPVIAAFRMLDDERFKMIADIASKNFGHVEGLTS